MGYQMGYLIMGYSVHIFICSVISLGLQYLERKNGDFASKLKRRGVSLLYGRELRAGAGDGCLIFVFCNILRFTPDIYQEKRHK